jgi:hypothetical protein
MRLPVCSAVAVALMLSAPAAGRTAPEPRPVWLKGDISRTGWVLREFRGQRVRPTQPEAVTLRFTAGNRLTGTTTCNQVGGDEIIWSGDPTGDRGMFRRNIISAATISTAIGCGDAAGGALGDLFWRLLADARSWTRDARGLEIVFRDNTTALLSPVR